MGRKKVIEVLNLTKKFGDFTAVDNVRFDVYEGEIFGFLGPNGAGKTTTINMLITLLKPTSGEAYVAGYNVVKEPYRVRRMIGVVFQDPTIDRYLTGYENMYIHGLIYGLPREKIRNRIDELLKFVDLYEFRDKPVKTYSGGMIRRLEIARSLLHIPKILFLDEPTLGLDPQTRAKIWEYIERLRYEHNVTIFMTTHYMDEAEKLCDRIAIIDHGRIIALDTPENLIKMVGDEVVYVRIDGQPIDIDKLRGINSYIKDVEIRSNQIIFSVSNSSKAIPTILEHLVGLGVDVQEVKYHKPDMGDVFLKLTGRDLRDDEGSWKDMVRTVLRRWR
ncbi:MAG TPA: ATP-binding cassette domain-containing protein [Thermoprotei archaeon]|nr:ATP-binding cassette domain-containing protein [Thermoprotei archaeon]